MYPRIVLLALLFGMILNVSAQGPAMNISSPVEVADGTVYGSIKPQIALANGNPLVLFGEGGSTPNVYISRWNGTGFTTPMIVNPSGMTPWVSTSDGPVIATSGDTVFVAYIESISTRPKIYIQRSLDGGATFGDTVRVDQLQNNNLEFISLAVGPAGNPSISFIKTDLSWANPEQVVVVSTDGGQTFTPEVNASSMAPGVPCECCPSSMVIEGNKEVLVFRNNDNNTRDVYASISNDGGNTFTSMVDIDFANWYVNYCPSSGPVNLISGDTLLAVWMTEAQGGMARINIGSLDLPTLQVGVNVEVDNNVAANVAQNYPDLAGSNDTLGVVWQDNRFSVTEYFLSVSVDGTSGFKQAMSLSDTISGMQRLPQIEYDNGVFHIVYQDYSANRVMYLTATLTGGFNGVNEEVKQFEMSLSPNPVIAESIVQINRSTNEPLHLNVHDQLGRLVQNYPNVIGQQVVIKKGSLKKGVYFLSIEGNTEQPLKFVVN
jgi:hypothetical protein